MSSGHRSSTTSINTSLATLATAAATLTASAAFAGYFLSQRSQQQRLQRSSDSEPRLTNAGPHETPSPKDSHSPRPSAAHSENLPVELLASPPHVSPTPAPSPSSPAEQQEVDFVILLHHVAKQRNIGNILRTACAFGVSEVICVGGRKQQFAYFGSHGSDKHVRIRYFDWMRQAIAYLKPTVDNAKDRCEGVKHQTDFDDSAVSGNTGYEFTQIVGLEITPGSVSVASEEFRRRVLRTAEVEPCSDTADSTAADGGTRRRRKTRVVFVPGNESVGITEADRRICDWFCYIPHHGRGTASLNVSCATATLLHRFTSCVGYPEAPREGEKFDDSVEGETSTILRGDRPTDEKERLRKERRELKERRERLQEEWRNEDAKEDDEGGGLNLDFPSDNRPVVAAESIVRESKAADVQCNLLPAVEPHSANDSQKKSYRLVDSGTQVILDLPPSAQVGRSITNAESQTELELAEQEQQSSSYQDQVVKPMQKASLSRRKTVSRDSSALTSPLTDQHQVGAGSPPASAPQERIVVGGWSRRSVDSAASSSVTSAHHHSHHGGSTSHGHGVVRVVEEF